jgi:hypothetical protein
LSADGAPSVPELRKIKGAVKVEDTPENRAFMIEQFEELRSKFVVIKDFAERLVNRFQSDPVASKVMTGLGDKCSFSIKMLDDAINDNLYSKIEIGSLVALFKMYVNDLKAIQNILKTVVRSLS